VYDGNGRVSKITYPTGFSVRRTYNTLGFLARVADWADASRVYWSIDSLGGEFPFDAKGNLLRQRFGDPSNAAGVQTFHDIDRVTGQARELRVGVASGVYGTQHTTYTYDNAGNVTTRNDLANNLQESFAYDRLYRLESHTVNGAVTRAVAMQYNATGNVLWKSDVGSYLYPLSGANVVRPHAVQTAAGVTYAYDEVGNVTSATGAQSRTHFWNRFGMPLSMAKGGTSMTWTYDPEHKRVSNVVAQGATTRYVYMVHPDAAGGLFYELELTVSGSATQVENRHYISATSGVIAVVKTYGEGNGAAPSTVAGISPTLAAQTQYWHKDALGSIVAVTDARGALIERMAYDAWGKRMYANGTADSAGSLNPSNGDRGYTGHEHLDELGFIHMNGRVYDPALGRFLSADPIIGSPDLLQDYNRYAYVRNNPLRFTDPTGECIECFVAIIAIGMIAEGNKYWKTVGTVALAWALGGSNGLVESGMGVPAKMTTAAGAVIGNPANSFIAGFITGTVASGGDLGAGIQSGVTAAAFTAVGGSEAFGTVERVIAHAVIGCMQSAISGSDCGPGALSAAFGKIATGAIEGLKLDWPVEGALAAIAGGTASVLGGGKFVNGALTAGFGYLFNHAAHAVATAGALIAEQLQLAAGPEGFITWEEGDSEYALRKRSGIFPAAVPGSPQELALAATVVTVAEGANYKIHRNLPATELGLPGKPGDFYEVYTVGGDNNTRAPERLARLPGSSTFYFSPYHYRPGPGAPNVWIELKYQPGKRGG
jgi:RHS repeat-associated protein